MTAIQNWHIIFLCHLIDSSKQTHKILLCINVFLAMCREQNILSFLKSKLRMNITSFNLCQVLVQHLCHRATSYICTLLRQSTISQISTSMLTVSHIHIADDIHDATVSLFWQTLVLTTITCFHVENGDMQALCTNHTQAAISITKNQHSIRFGLYHYLIAFVDDIAHRSSKVIAHSLHVNIRIIKFQILEEHTIQVIVVVLTCMRQQTIKILTTFINNCC